MPSQALIDLKTRIRDVDEILAARDAICPAGAGRPAQRKGSAVLAGGTVLLAAVFEGYIEDLYELSVDKLFAAYPAADRKNLKKYTSEKNHNANVHQVNNLFFYLGMPWVMANPALHWQKFTNAKVQERLGKLSKARNELAHGKHHTVTKPNLVAWREFIERLAEKLDALTFQHIQAQTGAAPW